MRDAKHVVDDCGECPLREAAEDGPFCHHPAQVNRKIERPTLEAFPDWCPLHGSGLLIVRGLSGAKVMTTEIATERGVRIRNLHPVEDSSYSSNCGYEFEALLNDRWWLCRGPLGNWTPVLRTSTDEPTFAAVDVGWWELDRIYRKHFNG